MLVFQTGSFTDPTSLRCGNEAPAWLHLNSRKFPAQRAQQRVAAVVIVVAALVREENLNPELQADDPAVTPAVLDLQIHNPGL